GKLNFKKLDMYQINHIYRYLFARELIKREAIVGDFACGTGYGSNILSENAESVIGIDINKKVIDKIKKRYKKNRKVSFLSANLLDLDYKNKFDFIISFETIEHLEESNIKFLFNKFYKALKNGGVIIFSTPFMQEKTKEAIEMGFHLTFNINEEKIINWLKETNFKHQYFKYQNYETHKIEDNLSKKDFILTVAKKEE
ncbi:MAG TPA: methyltransferase domain-containing protein, partial [Spirochaetota bacterium]|nr:methyltransferase domain-containing protein [Spirochaetota bacterium]